MGSRNMGKGIPKPRSHKRLCLMVIGEGLFLLHTKPYSLIVTEELAVCRNRSMPELEDMHQVFKLLLEVSAISRKASGASNMLLLSFGQAGLAKLCDHSRHVSVMPPDGS